MLVKALSLFVTAVVVVYIVVTQFADSQSAEAASPSVSASYSESQVNASVSGSRDCATNTLANPFGQTAVNCHGGNDAPANQGPNTIAAASSIGKTLRELEQCNTLHRDRGAAPAHCNNSAPIEASMVNQLEDLTRRGNSQARFELGMQLQRQEQRSGRQILNEADVAEDTKLQRAVALLAEAVAAGNVDAQNFRNSMGEHAKLLHTGR